MDLASDYKQRLKEVLQRKSIVWGKVKLSSGQESDYYFDCKPTTLDPEGAFLTAHAVLDLLEEKGIQADAIGGPPIGAHPIVSAVAAVSYLRSKEGKGRPMPAFLIRKQPKAHGLEKQIEGLGVKKIRNVVIIDDVCTKGESTLETLKIVERPACASPRCSASSIAKRAAQKSCARNILTSPCLPAKSCWRQRPAARQNLARSKVFV